MITGKQVNEPIQAVVRVRPLLDREVALSGDEYKRDILRKESINELAFFYTPEAKMLFHFDHIFMPESTQEEVYEATAKDHVLELVEKGYNITFLTYGQTATGKTYTILGSDMASPDEWGIIPRSVCEIFSAVENDTSGSEYTFKLSSVEIYKESIRDLFEPNGKNLRLHESPEYGVWVENLTEVFVSSVEEALELVVLTNDERQVAETHMNHVSSRSHCLFFVNVSRRLPDDSVIRGKLTLVDLAGSERVNRDDRTSTKAGQIMSELRMINQSLSALGNCIRALVEHKKGHIPFRDSKLTMLLRDCLGGNSKTVLYATITMHPAFVEETQSTLRFASQAKCVKNVVHANIHRSPEELTKMVDILKKDLRHFKGYVSKLERELLIREPKYDLEYLRKSGDKKRLRVRSKQLSARKEGAMKTGTGDEEKSSPIEEMGGFESIEGLDDEEERLLELSSIEVVGECQRQKTEWLKEKEILNGRIQHLEDELTKARDDRDEMEKEMDIEIGKRREIEKIMESEKLRADGLQDQLNESLSELKDISSIMDSDDGKRVGFAEQKKQQKDPKEKEKEKETKEKDQVPPETPTSSSSSLSPPTKADAAPSQWDILRKHRKTILNIRTPAPMEVQLIQLREKYQSTVNQMKVMMKERDDLERKLHEVQEDRDRWLREAESLGDELRIVESSAHGSQFVTTGGGESSHVVLKKEKSVPALRMGPRKTEHGAARAQGRRAFGRQRHGSVAHVLSAGPRTPILPSPRDVFSGSPARVPSPQMNEDGSPVLVVNGNDHSDGSVDVPPIVTPSRTLSPPVSFRSRSSSVAINTLRSGGPSRFATVTRSRSPDGGMPLVASPPNVQDEGGSLPRDSIGSSRGDASVMHMRGMLRKERQAFDEKEEMWRESMRKLRENHAEREEELQGIIERDRAQLLSLREILQSLTKPYEIPFSGPSSLTHMTKDKLEREKQLFLLQSALSSVKNASENIALSFTKASKDLTDLLNDVSRVAFLSWKLGFHLGNSQVESKDDEKKEGEESKLEKECNELSVLASSLRGQISKVDGSLRVISSGIKAFNFPEIKQPEKTPPSV